MDLTSISIEYFTKVNHLRKSGEKKMMFPFYLYFKSHYGESSLHISLDPQIGSKLKPATNLNTHRQGDGAKQIQKYKNVTNVPAKISIGSKLKSATKLNIHM